MYVLIITFSTNYKIPPYKFLFFQLSGDKIRQKSYIFVILLKSIEL